MKKEAAAAKLIELANENGILLTLYGAFGKKVKIRVPFSLKAVEMSVDEVDFSPRARHALKRSGIFNMGGVIDLIAEDGLLQIRNLGKKTENEIKTRVLVFGYERLSDAEKKRFFLDVIEKNSAF